MSKPSQCFGFLWARPARHLQWCLFSISFFGIHPGEESTTSEGPHINLLDRILTAALAAPARLPASISVLHTHSLPQAGAVDLDCHVIHTMQCLEFLGVAQGSRCRGHIHRRDKRFDGTVQGS